MSDVAGILYDKDAVYINVPGVFSKKADEDESGDEEDEPRGIFKRFKLTTSRS